MRLSSFVKERPKTTALLIIAGISAAVNLCSESKPNPTRNHKPLLQADSSNSNDTPELLPEDLSAKTNTKAFEVLKLDLGKPALQEIIEDTPEGYKDTVRDLSFKGDINLLAVKRDCEDFIGKGPLTGYKLTALSPLERLSFSLKTLLREIAKSPNSRDSFSKVLESLCGGDDYAGKIVDSLRIGLNEMMDDKELSPFEKHILLQEANRFTQEFLNSPISDIGLDPDKLESLGINSDNEVLNVTNFNTDSIMDSAKNYLTKLSIAYDSETDPQKLAAIQSKITSANFAKATLIRETFYLNEADFDSQYRQGVCYYPVKM
ncbi:hypothetical protein COU74_05360 [Candidatus Peregrinibacteria bacterium CG10_big_fil_rev_8_21_14_0_10_36_19]|nr:MAG: hypothetical protein COU74_05360 [Candidatus Peregrinibacteria bacterium CG10_big_fil_rev_8_21_14_0_10_36_19]